MSIADLLDAPGALDVLSALLAQAGGGGPGAPFLPMAIVLGVGVVVLVVIVAAGAGDKRRRESIVRACAESGLASALGDDPGLRAMMAHLPEMKRGRQALLWHASAVDGSGLRLFEHRAVIGAGKHRQTIVHTIAASPCAAEWPGLVLAPENLFTRLGGMLGWKDLQLDNPAFNARWRVQCSSEDFAIVALSPEMQEWLGQAPKKERWQIGSGWVCCMRAGTIAPSEAEALARRPAEFLALLPSELAAWVGPDPQRDRRPI
ncbi:MAG: hypothetical protein AB7Q91_06700 [Phycisphaerales bacterium]